jgi:FlaA1/EpsC-like NDP-sugar epimerase
VDEWTTEVPAPTTAGACITWTVVTPDICHTLSHALTTQPAERPGPDAARSPNGTPRAPGPATRRERAWQAVLSEPAFTVLTFAIDVAMCAVGVMLALAWGAAAGLDPGGRAQLWLFVPVTVGWLVLRSAYRRQLRIRFLDELEPLVAAISLSALTLLALLLALDDIARPGALVVRVWLLAVALLALGRLVRALIQRHARRQCRVGTPALIVGGGHVAQQIARRLDQLPEYGLRPIGLLHHEPPLPQVGDAQPPTLGAPDQLAEVAHDTGAEHVIIAFSSDPDERLVPLTRTGHAMGMDVSVVPRLFDAVGERVRVEHLGGLRC